MVRSRAQLPTQEVVPGTNVSVMKEQPVINRQRVLEQTEKDQYKNAAQFSHMVPSYQQQLRDIAGTQRRSALDQNYRTTNESFNSRGLLRSGLRQSALAGGAGQINAQTQAGILSSNQAVRDMEKQMQNSALSTSYAKAGMNPALGGLSLQPTFQEANDQMGIMKYGYPAMAEALKGIGAGIGTGLAKRNS